MENAVEGWLTKSLIEKTRVLDIRKGIKLQDIEFAVEALSKGQIILAATDTLYGLLGDAFRLQVVDRIFSIKRRAKKALLPLICSDIHQAKRVVQWPRYASALAACFWPGPLTLALPAQPNIPRHLLGEDGTLAVRVPNHELCRTLSREIDRPLTATSANLSGEAPAQRIEDIAPEILSQVSIILNEGLLPQSKPSTIVKIIDGKARLIRAGKIPVREIARIVGELIVEKK